MKYGTGERGGDNGEQNVPKRRQIRRLGHHHIAYVALKMGKGARDAWLEPLVHVFI
jgi:hypothetical protein